MEDVQKPYFSQSRTRWAMAVVKPGEIMGTLNVRSHQAVVIIPTRPKQTASSTRTVNLKYNADKQTIHEDYTGLIQRLDGAIRSRLTAAGIWILLSPSHRTMGDIPLFCY